VVEIESRDTQQHKLLLALLCYPFSCFECCWVGERWNEGHSTCTIISHKQCPKVLQRPGQLNKKSSNSNSSSSSVTMLQTICIQTHHVDW